MDVGYNLVLSEETDIGKTKPNMPVLYCFVACYALISIVNEYKSLCLLQRENMELIMKHNLLYLHFFTRDDSFAQKEKERKVMLLSFYQ